MTAPKRKTVLPKHKKVGSRFIPPWNYLLGPIRETSWVEQGIPEFIWIACLHRKYGISRGTELALALSRAAFAVRPENKGWFASLSEYLPLALEDQQKILANLADAKLLADLRSGLEGFTLLYPAHPLAFLLPAAAATPSEADRESLRNTLFPLYEKLERSTVLVQGTVIYLGFINDRLKVSADSVLARFPKLEDYPSTAESKMIAAAVRSMIVMITGAANSEESLRWAREFWNRGLKVDSCIFP